MDPVTIGMIAAPILGGLIGAITGAGSQAEANRIIEEASREFNIPLPQLKDLVVKEMGTRNWDSIKNDQGNRGVRDLAIQRLATVAGEGGMDAGSRLATEQARRAGAQQSASAQAGIEQEAARRGLGGAGVLAAKANAAQMGAHTASLGAMIGAGDARSRALQAMTQGAGLAGEAENSDRDAAIRRAQSLDSIARYNAELSLQTQQGNNALRQQQFGNKLGLAQARYGVAQDRANLKAGQAAQSRQMWGGMGQGVGMGLGAYGGSPQYQEWLKTRGGK